MREISSEDRAFFYSPYSFLKGAKNLGKDWLLDLKRDFDSEKVERFRSKDCISIFFSKLPWDTDFFGIPFYKIEFIECDNNVDISQIQSALAEFEKHISLACAEYYIFSEIPCEDIEIIGGFTGSGWRLIETRVTYYRDDLQKFIYPERTDIRNATENDILELRKTAIDSVNHYDRFHADDFFRQEESDAFLAKFVENSVKGFADEVIVPDKGVANAFLTGKYLESPDSLSHRKMAKMVLSAVGSERRGWYMKLISELSFKFKANGVDTAFMTTQATNRAVLRVWSKHGYQFGKCSHIFSKYKRNK
jgi:dTDP-4-amino-4,6-dideoxy-D-galactose acyltransferase